MHEDAEEMETRDSGLGFDYGVANVQSRWLHEFAGQALMAQPIGGRVCAPEAGRFPAIAADRSVASNAAKQPRVMCVRFTPLEHHHNLHFVLKDPR